MVYVRKQGRICTVFMDGNKPLPITDFDTEPTGFPMTYMGEDAVRAAFPGQEIRFVEQNRSNQPVAKRPPDSMVDKMMGEASQTIVAEPAVLRSQPAAPSELQNRALQYFKILLSQHQVAAKNKQAEIKLRAETCANTILAIWPDSTEALIRARDEMKGFTLG